LETSEQTFHRWRNQYGGMKAEEAKRLKKLEEENKRLKGLLAEAELDKAILREVKGNGPVLHAAGRRFTKSSGRWAFRNVERAGRWSNREPRSVVGRCRVSLSSDWSDACLSWCGSIRVTVLDESGLCCGGRAGA